ncbi:solute carrier family 2, facilitated glucose transporter member 11-like isoform X4 [Sceloporus undulatus]|uniref:solute carrier family 2, facilitated glucose transporter member 11-like isoform X4 n=1 Tax=Sceloporus undulatus TaxID=8520 RepID=UPI001C4AC871|nr:solute carrier family 2, facilitated glucose transporter member 11-like isoform X4 [Sceloporus undulatus]
MTTDLWELMQHRKLLQMIFVLGFGGTFQAGFQVSMITFTSPHVKSFLNASWTERSGGLPLPPETLTLLWSLVVSIFALGGLLGSMASGYLAAKYGKKRCLLANNLAMLAGSLLLGLSRVAASFELMLAGRFLCGLCTGLSVPLHPQFLGEASPKTLRGFANSTASAFWSLGKVFGQVMGQREVLGDGSRWPILMALSGLPALAQLLALPFFPESPPHLFLHRGDEEGCRKAMRALWGEGRPWQQQQEMEDLRKEKQSQRSGAQRSLGVSDLLRERRLRAQLFLVVLISVAVQLSGIQAIYSYTFEVLSAAGFEDDQIPHLSLGLSTFELLSTFLCSVAIERFGRRVLMWGGYCVMATLLAGLTLTLSLQHLHPWVPYGSLCLIFGIVFSFGMGPGESSSRIGMGGLLLFPMQLRSCKGKT